MKIEELKNKNGNFIIFKHSVTCPTSSTAKREVEKYKSRSDSLEVVTIIVQDNPSLKMQISELYGVKHESPQILVIKNKECIDNFSHFDITEENIKKSIR